MQTIENQCKCIVIADRVAAGAGEYDAVHYVDGLQRQQIMLAIRYLFDDEKPCSHTQWIMVIKPDPARVHIIGMRIGRNNNVKRVINDPLSTTCHILMKVSVILIVILICLYFTKLIRFIFSHYLSHI